MIAYPIFSQSIEKKTTEVTKQKEVSVNISTENGDRNIKVSILADGQEKVIAWEDDGTIPEDIKKQLEEEGVDINFDDNERSSKSKKIKIITMNDDSEHEWTDGKSKRIELNMDNMEWNHDNDDGREKMRGMKMRFTPNGEIEREVEILMDDAMGGAHFSGPRGNAVFFGPSANRASKAYMGARILDAEEGALIEDVAVGGPSQKAGLSKSDIVTKLNGARIRSMNDLLQLLHFYEPNDIVELTVLREGKEKKLSLTLLERPDSFR